MFNYVHFSLSLAFLLGDRGERTLSYITASTSENGAKREQQ